MKTIIKMIFLKRLILITILALITSPGFSDDVKKMTIQDLNKIMNDDIVSVIDVRRAQDWNSSKYKIKGAQRQDPQNFKTWSNKYPRKNTLVLYCA